jgi:hypothetical protein
MLIREWFLFQKLAEEYLFACWWNPVEPEATAASLLRRWRLEFMLALVLLSEIQFSL